MQEHDAEARDKLEATFGNKDSEATLTMPIAKSSEDDSIDILPLPKKKAGHLESPTPSVSVYFPGKITSIVFNDPALSVQQQFQQQLKKTEDDIINMPHEAKKIYETLSSFEEDHLGLKNTVEAYLNEVG